MRYFSIVAGELQDFFARFRIPRDGAPMYSRCPPNQEALRVNLPAEDRL